MKHILAYEGKVQTALALMQEAYVPMFVPWTNWRIGVEGTLQRPPYSIAMGVEWVQGLDKRKGQDEVFAVLVHSGKAKKHWQYVGHMGIHEIKWPHGTAKTGSILGAKNARGRGIGTEAKLLILYHAFMVLGIRKLTSGVKTFNAQSAGHLLKCGYKHIGTHRKHILHEGEYVDEALFEVFREDWEPIWSRYQESSELPHLTDDQRAFLKEIVAG